MLGWSILEGIGAALVLPALVALAAGNYQGKDRAVAYGVLGGVAGAGIAVGPILGGWATTEVSWRVVFVGEVVVAAVILLGTRLIREPAREGRAPRLDWVGSVLAALGLALIVIGVLQASNWGWLRPLRLADRAVRVLADPVRDRGRRPRPGRVPRLGAPPRGAGTRTRWSTSASSEIPTLRGGLSMLLAQNLILMGIFFTIPLYLQIVQGLDALETGVRMLPASVGPLRRRARRLARSPRGSPRARSFASGLAITLALDADAPRRRSSPSSTTAPFLAAMGVLGVGMGLVISQLGNVVQSAVGDARPKRGGRHCRTPPSSSGPRSGRRCSARS